MILQDAVRIVDKMVTSAKSLSAEEEVALLVVMRFVRRVVQARGAIRSVAEALDVNLNQESLFSEKSHE